MLVFIAVWAFLEFQTVGSILQLQCTGFSLWWLLLLWVLGCVGFSSCGSQVLEQRLNSCSTWAWLLCSLWQLPGSGLHLLHWQVGSSPVSHQGSPRCLSNHPDFYSSQAASSVLKCSLELHAMLNVRKGSMILENARLIKVKWATLLQAFSEPLLC